jgi:hypothetical protein
MSTKSVKFSITGLSDMLMHCGQTADPFNKFSKALKKLSSKRNKTDDDLMGLSNLEWWAGLYTDKPIEIKDDSTCKALSGTKLILPAHVLDSCVREGSRKIKLGKQASAGAIVEGDGAFYPVGVSDLNKIFADEQSHYRVAVKVGTAKVIRNRPRFKAGWSAEFSVLIDDSVIEIEQILQALENAGKLVGIGDWRPGAPRGGSFGRFVVEACK